MSSDLTHKNPAIREIGAKIAEITANGAEAVRIEIYTTNPVNP